MTAADDIELRLQLARAGGFALELDLQLPAHGITAVFGPSGSGKTTVLRCVAGLEHGARGTIRIGAETWQDDSRRVFVPTWRRPLGYVFQEASLFDHLDVRGNLLFGHRRTRGASTAVDLDAAIELLGIGHLLTRRPASLSGGERQRVAMACALAARPRLLLLDEPLSALDAPRRQEVLPWLERLRDELRLPMLYVTHSHDEMSRLADHVVLMREGRVQACGPVGQVLAQPQVAALSGDRAAVVLQVRVEERDPTWHLARATFAGGDLWLPDEGLAIGSAARVRLRAQHVRIVSPVAQPPPAGTRNLLRATLCALAPAAHPAQRIAQLDCAGTMLLASVSAHEAHQGGWEAGQSVWVQADPAEWAR